MRRRKLILFLLLIFTLIAFAYVRREIFFQQAKGLIEQNLARRLQCDFSIGNIRPGVFSGLIFEDLNIGFPGVSNLNFDLQVERAFIDYNLWEAFLANYLTRSRRANSDFVSGDFAIILERGEISIGEFVLLNNLEGSLTVNQKGIHFRDIQAAFRQNQKDSLKISGGLSQDELILEANLEHLRIGSFDILTNLSLNLHKRFDLQDKNPKISGTLKTYGSVLNNRPIPELSSSFEIRDERLRILTCSLGDNYDLRGIVSLTAPFNADLSLNFHQAAPHEFIANISVSEEPNFSGLVNGLIKITGDITRPKVDGYLEAKHGHIGDLDFVSADVNIKGRYPRIMIVDSRIRREEGSLLMEGEIDFTSFSGDFMAIDVTADKGMLWQGWDITRGHQNQVHMSKSISDDVRVTFDTFMEDDETCDFANDYKNELGVEYRVFGDKLLRLRLRKDEEILGLEQRIKF